MGKSSKKCCPSASEPNCCQPDCEVDCCSPAYLRLDKLRQGWVDVATSGTTSLLTTIAGATGTAPNTTTMTTSWVPATIFDRTGTAVPVPIGGTGAFGPPGASLTLVSPFGATGSAGAPVVNLITAAGVTGSSSMQILTNSGFSYLNNAWYAYIFVNTMRYQSFEACGKGDQVVGWYVNTSTGQLELFQPLPDLNLAVSDNRGYLIGFATDNLSSIQKQKLYQLNILYKLSLKAVERVGQDPKEEGNICEFTDKCGQKWLLAINRANSQSSVIADNYEYVIVSVPLC